MHWNYHAKAPKHWDSVMPHGYFIVVEENDDGDSEYVVYQGHYDDWRLMTRGPLVERGRYGSLNEAKKFEP